MARFFRLIFRGIRDWYEQFTWFMVLSLAFCLCVLPLIVGWFLIQVTPMLAPVALLLGFLVPPAIHGVFDLADPRRQISRPELREAFDEFADGIAPGWKIAGCTIPILLVLFWNIRFFGGNDSNLIVFVPLWAVMFIFVFITMMYMFSISAVLNTSLRNAFRGAMYVLVKRPFAAFFLSILTIFFVFIMSYTVAPMMILGPAITAAIINRFVMDELEVEIIDPNAPTSERSVERAQGINPERTIWERLKLNSSRRGRRG